MRGNTIITVVRYQKILDLRGEGKTFQEIADVLEISRQRVFQIYQRARKRLGKQVTMSNHRDSHKRAA
jgi:DNA-directed RNA polymerase specialized sigma subunit